MGTIVNEAPFAGSANLGAPPTVAGSRWVVLKFGGSCLAGRADWEAMAGIVGNRLAQGFTPLVVLSAIGGATNGLERLLDAVECGDGDVAGAELEDLDQRHRALAGELGLQANAVLDPWLAELDTLVRASRGEAGGDPQWRAQVLALGEFMASSIGVAWLRATGLDVAEHDARSLLVSDEEPAQGPVRRFLAATCHHGEEAQLGVRLRGSDKAVSLTQGCIAADPAGRTVWLGREGSDTSAAYLAARLLARRLEVWTDVPGIFTADPKLVPSARLLTALHYDEARELAATGSRVLHPRCIGPLEDHGIPLFIRCIGRPAMGGTVVSRATPESEPQVKGVSARPGITLLSLDRMAPRLENDFVLTVLASFRRHGVGVALIATSPNNLTVTLDPDEPADYAARQALFDELSALCQVRVIEDCAAISLVGRRIRSILPLLAPAFGVFEEQQIHLVSQAANDLNLSFVVNGKQMPRLVSRLHDSVVKGGASGGVLGPTWQAMFDAGQPPLASYRDAWWIRRRADLLTVLGDRQHAFVYDADTLRAAAESLLSMPSVDRVLYAMKANFNPDLLRLIGASGVDFECVSPGEVEHVRSVIPDIEDDRILFTPNFAPRAEYRWAVEQGLQLTLDNLFPLRAWPELFGDVPLFIRIDPGRGQGHHEHVRTGGQQSKFGVPAFAIDELESLVKRAGARVVGIHAHAGSGIQDPGNWKVVGETLAQVAARFPEVEVLDLGGGLGVPNRAGDPPFDLDALDASLAAIKAAWPRYRLWLEPGRYLVSGCGVLLARVTQTKGKGDRSYVGVSTGMNSLIRPALYGAWHEIVNLTRADEPATESVTVVGPICETGDRLGTDRMLPPCRENDILLIVNAGAYGRAMSSRYNLREPADELVI